MNNYSWLEEKLHQFALASQFMREVSFEFENIFVSKKNNQDDHVFISGLARSGTTILLNAIYQSKEFASLSYDDMPFILAPNSWAKISPKNRHTRLIERAHRDGIKISSESPEAFEEVFWRTFNDGEEESGIKFKHYVQSIEVRYNKNRYLSKNNQNIRRLRLISEIFPNSKILIPFRNPIQQANSLLTQHKNFIEYSKKDNFISKYMKLIGHTEFGPHYEPINSHNLVHQDYFSINHWLEQWYLIYLECLEKFSENKNFYFICYEDLCESKDYWFRIIKLLSLSDKYDFIFTASEKNVSYDLDANLLDRSLALYGQLGSKSYQ
tara:strand:+ start:1328 stop:2299 length:972 start_codon:yes stop_codon:yes gene_type:complete